MNELSTFLFARPSFSEGVGRTLDFGNTLTEYNRSLSAEQADLIATWMDWGAVGYDLRKEIEKARRALESRKKNVGKSNAALLLQRSVAV